ncbi:MAG: hypothetical protein ACI90V_008381, partial [Bacillariaceae sp.]
IVLEKWLLNLPLPPGVGTCTPNRFMMNRTVHN